MSFFTIGWIGFLLYFAVLEGYAIASHEGGATLSEHVRLWFSTKTKGKMWLQRRVVFAVLVIWFFIHILFDGPGPL